ncbi:response regulator [Chitinophaga agrisoli]|uniref:Response regulator n=1 Tax=Chitinophaga agrisoli TaxID=2607653 RepID=A0A5B2VNN0_9BACT|nr:response regulator [Chitinophaga agrisoli]KAA2240290.1 response regulator [Chitinophaga agrisoli]
MKKILLIEDNNEIRDNVVEMLELARYSVLTATNGMEGVELAIAQSPDLIICDIMMPVLDGYGVLNMLHKNKTLQEIPFIFLTAKAEKAEIRKGMEMGADDYITKPFDTTELLNAVETRLRKAASIKADLPADINGLDILMTAVMNKDIQEIIRRNHNIHKYKKKQEIYMEGHPPACLFYILKGKVRTFKRNEGGKELVIGLYREGDFLGYTALLEQSVYNENAEALDDTELAIIPREDFEALLFNNPGVIHKFIQLLCKHVTEKEEQLLDIAYNSLRKKVSQALLLLYKKYNPSYNEHYSIDMSRDGLAALTGVAKESLIRTLGDFREEKLISIREGQIFVTDRKRLEVIAN